MNSDFKEEVYALIAKIPEGKVVTYGQVAALCGHPGAARTVGQIAHFGPSYLPWQRLVNAQGGMARAFWPDGPEGQARMLKKEGVVFINHKVNMKESVWWPKK